MPHELAVHEIMALNHGESVTSLAFSRDGGTLATTRAYNITLWDVATGQELMRFAERKTGDAWSVTVAYSPDGTILASGCVDADRLTIWDAQTGQSIYTLTGHADDVNTVAFSHHGTLLASGSDDATIKLWEVATWRNLRTLRGHDDDDMVVSVAFSPDDRMLASGSMHQRPDDFSLVGSLKLWDVATGREIATLLANRAINVVTFSPHGGLLAAATEDTAIPLWDIATGKELAALPGSSDATTVSSVSFSPDGTILASGNSDGSIRLWDIATSSVLNTLDAHDDCVNAVLFSPDGTLLASASADNTAKVWQVVQEN